MLQGRAASGGGQARVTRMAWNFLLSGAEMGQTGRRIHHHAYGLGREAVTIFIN